MSTVSSIKFMLTCGAVVALSFCFANDVSAQGVRIGSFFQAGGGQGFRLGGPRAGMHFGGGQGASIGTQRFGMRFGNGQGARFGGASFGMQFGGGQGTQIGQLQTTTSGTPGTYYYGDVNGGTNPRPMAQRPVPGQPNAQPIIVGQPIVPQPAILGQNGPAMIPSTPHGRVIQAPNQPSPATLSATGTVGNPAPATQTDIARRPTPVSSGADATREASKPAVAPEPTVGKSILVNEAGSVPAKAPTGESDSKAGGKDN